MLNTVRHFLTVTTHRNLAVDEFQHRLVAGVDRIPVSTQELSPSP
jgi:hypothetical protein